MALREDIEKQGSWLFRWRSYFPLFIIPFLLIALHKSEWFERAFGEAFEQAWGFLCLGISLSGLLVRALVAGYAPLGTSGRNTRSQAADELNTTGMYSLVRNPLYLGNFLIFLGFMLFVEVWWFVLLGTLAFWIYYERIIFTEEEYLRKKFGNDFLEWADKTPMFFPDRWTWRSPKLAYSWKTLIRREFPTLFLIVASFAILDFFADLLSERVVEIDAFWTVVFGAGSVLYLVFCVVKKKTKLLKVPGR